MRRIALATGIAATMILGTAAPAAADNPYAGVKVSACYTQSWGFSTGAVTFLKRLGGCSSWWPF